MKRWVVSGSMADFGSDMTWRLVRLETQIIEAENKQEALGFFLFGTWAANDDGRTPMLVQVLEIKE